MPAHDPHQLPPGTKCLLDQPYVTDAWKGNDPDSAQTLDLYVPAGDGPFPIIVWIHGGGWHSLGKQPHGLWFASEFGPHGFAVASIAYRLTPDAPFPAQIEDCHLALDWLREHAAEHALDTQLIGVVGHSAGAHLCALVATGGIVPSSKPVQAAVCWSPPCDMDRDRGAWPKDTFIWNPEGKFSQTFFPSKAYEPQLARYASPVTHAHASMPPILIIHGDKDPIVPLGQAVRFAEQLRTLGVNVTHRTEIDGTHDIMNEANNTEAIRFFTQILRPMR
jgi:acetyl esterase/lipase